MLYLFKLTRVVSSSRVFSLYKRLHASGIYHGDISWRHILGHRKPLRSSAIRGNDNDHGKDDYTDNVNPKYGGLEVLELGSLRLIDFSHGFTRVTFARVYRTEKQDEDPVRSGGGVIDDRDLEAGWRELCEAEMAQVEQLFA